MSNSKKNFDAVAMMRSIRDEISIEIDGMTLEEEREWMATREIQDSFLRLLRERANRESAEKVGGPPRR